MSQVSKPVRYLLLATWFFLALALGKNGLKEVRREICQQSSWLSFCLASHFNGKVLPAE